MNASVDRVVAAAAAKGIAIDVLETDGARSAEDAARAIGTSTSRIVKSLVFVATRTSRILLLLMSGSNRVDEGLVAALMDEPIRRASADEVRDATGFAIGGVSPFGASGPVRILMDEDLFAYPTVWAAAGTPKHVFEIVPLALRSATGAEIAAIKAS